MPSFVQPMVAPSHVAITSPIVVAGQRTNISRAAPLTVAWNGAGRVVSKVGDVNITFTSAANGIINYTVNGASAARSITRQTF